MVMIVSEVALIYTFQSACIHKFDSGRCEDGRSESRIKLDYYQVAMRSDRGRRDLNAPIQTSSPLPPASRPTMQVILQVPMGSCTLKLLISLVGVLGAILEYA